MLCGEQRHDGVAEEQEHQWIQYLGYWWLVEIDRIVELCPSVQREPYKWQEYLWNSREGIERRVRDVGVWRSQVFFEEVVRVEVVVESIGKRENKECIGFE